MYAETAFFDYASSKDTEQNEAAATRLFGNQSYEFISECIFFVWYSPLSCDFMTRYDDNIFKL